MSENGRRIPRSIIDTGIIVLIIVSIGFSGYMINQALEIQIASDKKIEELKKTTAEDRQEQKEFIDKWAKRINVSNTVQNGTRDFIRDEIRNFANNLTAHRHVTNATFDEVKSNENKTIQLIQMLNQTNNNERDKAVDRLHADHEIIMNALNISKTDNQSEAASKIDQLLEILNKTQ